MTAPAPLAPLWQDLHPIIKFHDVTELCDAKDPPQNITLDSKGNRESDCDEKEVWITLLNPNNADNHLGETMATAEPTKMARTARLDV